MKFCFWYLRRSIFPDRGAVFAEDLYNRRRRFRWMHASGMGGEARGTVFFGASNFHGAGGQGGKGFDASLPSAAAL